MVHNTLKILQLRFNIKIKKNLITKSTGILNFLVHRSDLNVDLGQLS